ncbi:lipopolysaccharide heptosyltransferase I [Herbaspirillum sp.]|uniref:lipopolysaccharide heptosyltransferase I n=1 Tax=Herbaspirillum TaxID=963 RepID=UPI0025831E49|nr:lipopolysaccharide heptosyltransferase I [Herbaspirillum sp.]MCP3654702.1 lipopolysaccharide heptosyltransferase I [Herbaspirillum sp.]MCP3948786.1 lipopolysaccharide heptosyltransferase I [Herbaspirillum sp.]MCP4033365.1 lipopolysaccharide heptosyltransferase I [Herbaspirillum sp.]MCP4556316.1 lipopolysaccharide heptosyltransferase I [Herbaspirillum sp.]
MNILIVRVSSLGDVVHNMPMVADIHRHFPAAQIDWVVEEGYTSLVGLNPHVRKIIPIALRRWRKTLFSAATRAEIGAFRRELQAERYDLVFDTQGLLKTSVVMRMARLAPQGRRIGLANATEGSGYEPISRIFHDQSIPVGLRTHAVTRARLVAAAALGYQLEGQPDFALRPPEPARWAWMPEQPYVVFFHGTARAAKQWPQAQWIKLGQALAERGLQILLPWGSAREQEAARQLAAGIPGATVLPALPMMQAVALVQQARLVVGLDTGLTHIAAAYGKPTIELYCDSPRWKTEGNWSPAIINLGDLGAPPSEEDVLKAALGLLA